MSPTEFTTHVAEMHTMASVIVVELPQLYIIRHQDDLPLHDSTRAYALNSRQSVILRERMTARGIWNGCRPSIVFGGIDNFSSDELRGIFIHELAHLTPVLPDVFPFEPSAAVEQFSREMFTECERDTVPRTQEPWLQGGNHGADFVRRALHLHFRAINAGWAMSYRVLNIAGARYGLSDAWRYSVALADEPHRMRGASFDEIESTPPPAAFSQVFESNKQRFAGWLARVNQKDEHDHSRTK